MEGDNKLREATKVTLSLIAFYWSERKFDPCHMFLLICNPKPDPSHTLLYLLLQKIINRCRKLAGMLGCAASVDVHVPPPGGSTRALASSSHTGGGSSSHVASSSRLVNETEEEEEVDEEEEEEEGEEEGGDDEEGDEEEYDDDDGPQPTQPTQAKRVSHPHQDALSPSPFQKPVPHHRSKKPDEGRSKTNEERAAKRGTGRN